MRLQAVADKATAEAAKAQADKAKAEADKAQAQAEASVAKEREERVLAKAQADKGFTGGLRS